MRVYALLTAKRRWHELTPPEHRRPWFYSLDSPGRRVTTTPQAAAGARHDPELAAERASTALVCVARQLQQRAGGRLQRARGRWIGRQLVQNTNGARSAALRDLLTRRARVVAAAPGYTSRGGGTAPVSPGDTDAVDAITGYTLARARRWCRDEAYLRGDRSYAPDHSRRAQRSRLWAPPTIDFGPCSPM